MLTLASGWQSLGVSPIHAMNTQAADSSSTKSDTDPLALCLSCLHPSDPSNHFCPKCGAPLTSYASTGPFEHLFAEGYVYRQAVGCPRSPIVLIGVWMIFGPMAAIGAFLLATSRQAGIADFLLGAAILLISVLVIWRATRQYCLRRQPGAQKEMG
jgi:rubredoxin